MDGVIYINKSKSSGNFFAIFSIKWIKAKRAFGWARRAPMIQPSTGARKDPPSGQISSIAERLESNDQISVKSRDGLII